MRPPTERTLHTQRDKRGEGCDSYTTHATSASAAEAGCNVEAERSCEQRGEKPEQLVAIGRGPRGDDGAAVGADDIEF